jgi:capsular polysaccharide transport system ATP-binding protein
VIELHGVTKAYRHPTTGRNVVLDDCHFAFPAGNGVGITGRNGAGKSTLLRLLSGAERPDHGEIIRRCRVSWPLGFAGGLHGRMTGRDNVLFVARLYGEDPRRLLNEAADFADLGKHFDAPVATYSSGMKARLAFGISLAIAFDVYLIDEVIAVGDSDFKARCAKAFEDRAGRAQVILVSHDPKLVTKYCDLTATLGGGKLAWTEHTPQ